jgi:hypothetical protein
MWLLGEGTVKASQEDMPLTSQAAAIEDIPRQGSPTFQRCDTIFRKINLQCLDS